MNKLKVNLKDKSEATLPTTEEHRIGEMLWEPTLAAVIRVTDYKLGNENKIYMCEEV